MISVTLYRGMKKDYNSTKLPADDGTIQSLATFDCAIHEPCSVQTPTIIIAAAMTYDMVTFNYAYIPAFHRYYWINDISWNDGRWWLAMSCDVLATYKTEIGASTQYVTRSESLFDTGVPDNIYPPIGGKTLRESTIINPPYADELTGGCYIMGITSATSQVGSNLGTTYYVKMSAAEMAAFAGALLSNNDYLNLDAADDLSDNVSKIILNPIQYIQSIRWFPINITGGASERYLYIGWWAVEAYHSPALANSNVATFNMTFTIPRHSQISTHGDYLKLAPFSSYSIMLPVAGEVTIPSDLIFNDVTLKATCSMDIVTGTGRWIITGYDEIDTPHEIMTFESNMAVEVPIAQIYKDVIKTAGNLGSAIVNALTGNFTGILSSGVNALISSAEPIASFHGGEGNIAAYRVLPSLRLWEQAVAPMDISHFGKPLCKPVQISTLSGFIMCGSPHVAIAGATAQEVQQIEQFMREGFRYE